MCKKIAYFNSKLKILTIKFFEHYVFLLSQNRKMMMVKMVFIQTTHIKKKRKKNFARKMISKMEQLGWSGKK